MPLWSVVLLGLSVSVDSLAVGIAYSMQKIRIPWFSLLIIGFCTASLMGLSILIGQSTSWIIPEAFSVVIGGGILVGIGSWQLFQGCKSYLRQLRKRTLIGQLGLIKDPGAFDIDRSGSLDRFESLLLGLALGMDAFAAGFAVAMLGFAWWHIPIVASICVGLVYIGFWVGRRNAICWLSQRGFVLSGLLLIGLGLWRLLF
ncbi:MAG: manganese efflux pump [Limnochordia bacterium]|nr:manganese efflux pump [Limnochordia bacterium]